MGTVTGTIGGASQSGGKGVAYGELGTKPYGAGSSGAKPAGATSGTITAAPVLSWLTHPEAYQSLVARGVKSPGNIPIGGVKGWKRSDKWDVKESKGAKGATETHVGIQPAKGSFTFEVWDEDGIAAWASYLALFKFDASKGLGAAIDVYHPQLASLQPPVTRVVMTDHTTLDPDHDGRGLVTIDLLEYFPQVATGATTASGSQGGQNPDPSGTQEDPAFTKLQKQRDALYKQAQALPN